MHELLSKPPNRDAFCVTSQKSICSFLMYLFDSVQPSSAGPDSNNFHSIPYSVESIHFMTLTCEGFSLFWH